MKLIIDLIKNRIFLYIFSGGMGAITNIGILFILTEFFNINYLISGVISFLLSVIVSFSLQKNLTFNDRDRDINNTHKKFIYFLIIALLNLIINTGILYCLTEYIGFYYILSQIFAGLIVAIWSYFVYKVFVFNSSDKLIFDKI